MARIRDAALFCVNTEDDNKFMFCDVVEIHERPARKSFFDDERGRSRVGKRNGKRRSYYRPLAYRGETKIKIFLLPVPNRPMIPFRSSF